MNSSIPALSVKGLVKTYADKVQALQGIDLQVETGDFFALLGPNGAGKSTLIGIITSLVNKTSGKVKIFGHDIDQDFSTAKSYLGVVPQEYNMNIFDTVENTLIYQAGYYGISPNQAKNSIELYLRKLGLWEKRKTIINSLSGGMKRRLMIARALIHHPQMLILDEPTAGVDIEIRRSMWQFLSELNQQGITIILTTHYLEEAENLCRNIAIIDKGKIIANASMSEMLRKLDKERFILYLESPYEKLPLITGYTLYPLDPYSLEVEVLGKRSLNFLLNKLGEVGITVISMRNKSNRLEELFLELTGSNFR
ncbi:MAG: ABC transporter ATP-binding protein [Proteobacteria bacterium]|nr:ABC transporter ATP-binding protein [Pseudomonadota bacterium]